MNSVFLFILLFLFTVSIIPLFFIIRLSRYIHLWTAQTKTTNAKKHVTIIIPTCGKTYNLKNNLDRVINNSYENSRTILTTTQDDLSKEILFELQTQYPDKVRVTLATKSYGNAQKLKNQLTALETIKEQTDYLVFIDADKENYVEYFNLIKPKVQSGSVILFDNVLWYGKVLEENPKQESTKKIQELNDLVAQDTDFENLILPLRDGVNLIRRK